jgi:Putative transposase
LDTDTLEKSFQHKVLKRLLRKGKLTEEVVKLILSWRHSGFNVHAGSSVQLRDQETMGNLARYIIRALFFQERMACLPDESKLIYRLKDGKSEQVFDALRWMSAIWSHVPDNRNIWS